MKLYEKDVENISKQLQKMPKYWDGKECVLELKDADYQWRQMEWWAFYFEFKANNLLSKYFDIPGDFYGKVKFDVKGKINWDIKASAIKTNNQNIILNDKLAMDKSTNKVGFHGEIIALCDVEYNDITRSFQKWHTELKGGLSSYELARVERTSVSRYRKTKAVLEEVVLVLFEPKDLEKLSLMKQGRNSDGSTRKVKYMLEIEQMPEFTHYIIKIK